MSANRRLAAMALPAVLTLLTSSCAGSDEEAASATASSDAQVIEAPDDTDVPVDTEAPAATEAPPETAKQGTDTAPPEGITRLEVTSTVDEYFVLYVTPDPTQPDEMAVAATLGQEGTTVLTDGRTQLPDEQYRVERRTVADPADTDGDGIDDITELADPTLHPLNPAPAMDIDLGTTIIEDRATFETLSYQGDDVLFDDHLAGIEYLKFIIADFDNPVPEVYLINTENYRGHPIFAQAVGMGGGMGFTPGQLRGQLAYLPEVEAADGSMGVYRFEFQPNDSFSFADIQRAYEVLATSMPFLAANLAYYPMPPVSLPRYEEERNLYDASRVPVLLDTGLVAPRAAD